MKRTILYACCIVCAAVSLSGCGPSQKATNNDVVPVRIQTVTLQDLNKVLEYAGDIKGQDEAVVYPKVSGKIVEKVKDDGDPVRKGEAIAYIDRDEVGLKYEKAPVESPLAGTVGRVYIDIGSNVTTQTPIALVADMTKTEIDLDIPEMYLPYISLGQKATVTIDAHPRDIFSGTISQISPIVDLATRTAPIEVVIDNPERKLQSGMFAKVRLNIEEHPNVPTIMKEAIIGKNPDTYVYVIRGDKSYLTKVTLGIRQGPVYEVREGLKEGDKVVVMGQQRLREGSPVRSEE